MATLKYHTPIMKIVSGKFRRTFVTATCPLCKKEFSVLLTTIKKGKIKSCRCFLTKHGMYGTRFYSIWNSMICRCKNRKHKNSKYYTLKGIKVCERWKKFENFKEDMFSTYKEGLTLDRIDGNKGYYKQNCRWVTQTVQNGNRATVILYKGENASQASLRLGGAVNLIYRRLENGWSLERAFTTPPQKQDHSRRKRVY